MRTEVVLSRRLLAVAAMVSKGNRVCDVGCDHGFVPIYLLKQGISPWVLAMDVGTGPLSQAKEHIAFYGLEDYIETRLSNGLEAYQMGEADTLICAGMGGRLMMQILEANPEKTASFKELILQPQSDIPQFRCFLRRQGYLSVEENMIEEDGKFYPMMKVVKTLQNDLPKTLLEDKYGRLLLQNHHPVLQRYLEREKGICEDILKQLAAKGLAEEKRQKRYAEIEKQLQDCLRALDNYEKG